MRSMTSSFSSSLHNCSYRASLGQSTIEAAVLIPSVLVLIALLVQPACLLYTQMLMRGAAAETARAVLTARNDSDLSACKDFGLRRLAAVPEVSPFHVGGQGDWHIKTSDGKGGFVRVSITGHARPLPLFGGLASVFYERDGTGLVLHVDMTERMRPEWLGGAYADWVSVWK
ncbi:TadE family protein [Atopobium sp. oral taxon 810]|uniref:TadE family protein n=1 Tax=Atopobium sp. oral taxon 810 TaxID=712158 RepID=UPI000683EFC1